VEGSELVFDGRSQAVELAVLQFPSCVRGAAMRWVSVATAVQTWSKTGWFKTAPLPNGSLL